jgi:hypothetical protein
MQTLTFRAPNPRVSRTNVIRTGDVGPVTVAAAAPAVRMSSSASAAVRLRDGVRASAEWRLAGGRSSTLQLRRGVRRGARRRARIVPGDITSLLAGLPPGRSNSPAWLPPSMKAAVWYLSSSPRSPRPLSGRTRPGVACRGCGPGRYPAREPHTRVGGWTSTSASRRWTHRPSDAS